MAGKETTSVYFSNFKNEVLKILEKNNFILKFEKKGRSPKKALDIFLKYEEKMPVFNDCKKVSKPGRKIFLPANKIKTSHGGQGITIISTSKGLMTGYEARKQKLGGEVICEIW